MWHYGFYKICDTFGYAISENGVLWHECMSQYLCFFALSGFFGVSACYDYAKKHRSKRKFQNILAKVRGSNMFYDICNSLFGLKQMLNRRKLQSKSLNTIRSFYFGVSINNCEGATATANNTATKWITSKCSPMWPNLLLGRQCQRWLPSRSPSGYIVPRYGSGSRRCPSTWCSAPARPCLYVESNSSSTLPCSSFCKVNAQGLTRLFERFHWQCAGGEWYLLYCTEETC